VRPDIALGRLNVRADEITDVVITHPHVDHIGGLDLFPKARVWMQEKDFAYFVGGAWQPGGNHLGLNNDDVLKVIRANLDGRLRLIKGDSVEIIPGIRVFTGSRHTFDSQHLLVQTHRENVLLASDDAWFYYNIRNLIPVPATFDAAAYAAGLRRMLTLVSSPEFIIPGHDAAVMTKFERVAGGIVKIR
jgi:glyoxylase-like metal-dependent hydrolase (beta-lactamase superfamily II)